MVAIRITLSRGGFGVAPVMLGRSSALLVSVPIRGPLWGGMVIRVVRQSFCTIAAIGAGAPGRPAMVALRSMGCGRGGGVVGDGDLDAAGRGTVSRCRPLWALRWFGGAGGCAVVVGAASGVTEQGVGGQQLP